MCRRNSVVIVFDRRSRESKRRRDPKGSLWCGVLIRGKLLVLTEVFGQMSANVMAKQTEQISETDLSGELQSSKAQIRRLTKAQAEAEERVRYPHPMSCIPCTNP